jgi:PAS domain S-box-containing protein
MNERKPRISVLVIEDNQGDFYLIEEYLIKEFVQPDIDHVESFQQALMQLKNRRDYDVVLLDLTLPDARGEKLVTDIVNLAGHIPVIVLTGYSNQEFGVKTMSLGASDYLLKDGLDEELLKRSVVYSTERKKISSELEDSEKQYRELFDLNPVPMWVYDLETKRFLDVNQAAVDHYGYSEEEFFEMSINEIRLSKMESDHADDDQIPGDSVIRGENLWKHQTKSGKIIDVEVQSNETFFNGIPSRIVLANDLTEKIKAEQEVLKKGNLLAAGSEIAGLLLQKIDWEVLLDNTLYIIGKAVDVDRVYYFENHLDPVSGKRLISQRNEWSHATVTSELENPDMQNLPADDFLIFMEPLAEGKPFKSIVGQLPDSDFKRNVKEQGIRSILALPINIDENFVGFIGLDDCKSDRVWTDEVIRFLTSVTSNLANAIEKRNAIDELKQSEQRFKALVHEGSDLIAILDENANYKYVAPTVENVLGFPAEEFLDNNALDYIHIDDKERIIKVLDQLPIEDRIEIEPYRFRDLDGTWRWLETIVTNMTDNPAVGGYVANSRDITQRKKEEEQLKLLESAITNTQESVVILESEPSDLPGRKIVFANQAFTEMTGYAREEVIGQTLHFLNGPGTNRSELKRIRSALEKGESVSAEFLNYRKNGEEFWVSISMVPVSDNKGRFTHWISIGRDVTHRREQEEEIKKSLREKEILLAEIHHRVKNNLAVVSAMLQLQAAKEEDQDHTSHLLDSVGRIKTIANIHEQLYQSNNFSRIDIARNVEVLVEKISQTFDPDTLIEVIYDLNPVNLNVNQAVPFSLIVNEVMTNSMKHAFDDKSNGKIELNLARTGEKVLMTIRDNGIGLPDLKTLQKGNTLGIQIISVLTQQLKAEFSYQKISNGNGTLFSIAFDKMNIKGSSSAFYD